MKKKILFLGCNYSQVKYLKEIKKTKKFKIFGTDINKNAVGKKYCDKFFTVSYEDTKKLISIGKKEKFNNFDKIFTASSQISYLAASKFAEYFNIKFPKKKFIETSINKVKFYNFLKKNKILVPKFHLIKNQRKLIEIIKIDSSKDFFLKSDFSKNPNYVYQISKTKNLKVNWRKDCFFKKYYVLQELCIGSHLRINYFDQNFNYFYTKKIFPVTKKFVKEIIFPKVKKIVKKLHLIDMIVKFDIIITKEKNIYFLDLGIDPPFRMRKEYIKRNLNFEKLYIYKYLLNHKSIFKR